ncbi:hypothetical protein ACOMHN_065440 [Nucella lapillus]
MNPGPSDRRASKQSTLRLQNQISSPVSGDGAGASETSIAEVIKMLTAMDKKIGNLQATMDEQMDAFRNEMTGMLKENHELKEKIDRLDDKMDDLEGRSRRNNLIFHGIPSPEGQTELWSDCEKAVRKVLREEMGVAEDVELERAHRLRGGGKSPRPIIACFSKFKDKERVLANRKMLREKKSSIFVNEDFTPRVRDRRRLLLPFLKQAKAEQKRAFLRFDTLVIEGKAHTFNPATQKLVPRQGQP